MQQNISEEWGALRSNTFLEKEGKFFVGGEEIPKQLELMLRDEASLFLNTRLWDILYSTITAEAYDIALKKSGDFNQVLFAKALDYSMDGLRKILITLAKKK